MYKPGDHVVAMPVNDQGLTELYICPENEAVKTPGGCENDEAAVLIQPLCTVMRGVDRLGDVTGKRVTVVGAGPIGLLAIWLLKAAGAGPVMAVDPVGLRLEAAKRLGVEETLQMSSTQARALVRSGALEFGEADLTVEAVGHCQQTVSDAIFLTKRMGTLLALGVPDQKVYAFEYDALFRKNLCFITSVTPDWREYMDKAAALYAEKGEEISFLISHRLPLEQAAEGFALAESRQCLKVLLDACEFGT
jgi:threonine dehydrogenase-like Zn-dependent dehydrogenase